MFSSSIKRSSSDSTPPWASTQWAADETLRTRAAASGDGSFYDSSWELRRGLEVAELSYVPAEWREVAAEREAARAPRSKRDA